MPRQTDFNEKSKAADLLSELRANSAPSPSPQSVPYGLGCPGHLDQNGSKTPKKDECSDSSALTSQVWDPCSPTAAAWIEKLFPRETMQASLEEGRQDRGQKQLSAVVL